MNKLIKIIFIIVFFSCNSDLEYQTVIINKSIKVFSKEYHNKAENYLFKWEPPLYPNGEPVMFDLKDDMLIFTPELEGKYHIHLSITDISNQIVAEEMFYYNAIKDTINNSKSNKNIAIIEQTNKAQQTNQTLQKKTTSSNSKIKKTTKSKVKKTPSSNKPNSNYTIQFAAWPSLEQANSDKIELIDEGFDAYIQRFYIKNKDEVWYRVRIGNFKTKKTAIKIKNQIESITNKKCWLDKVR